LGGQTQYWNGTAWTVATSPMVPAGQAWSLDAISCGAGKPCTVVGSRGPKGTTGLASQFATHALAEQTSIGES
jgi:hypothetical protein